MVSIAEINRDLQVFSGVSLTKVVRSKNPNHVLALLGF
jgi:hypothetical protein